MPRISRLTLPHLRHVLKITFDVTLILEVCPGNRDFLQDRQIIFFTLRLGLFPCFFPIARTCLATVSEICESLVRERSNIFSRKSTDSFACWFLLGLIRRLCLAIFSTSEICQYLRNGSCHFFNGPGPFYGVKYSFFHVPIAKWLSLFMVGG